MELECFNEDDFALALKRNIRALTVGKLYLDNGVCSKRKCLSRKKKD